MSGPLMSPVLDARAVEQGEGLGGNVGGIASAAGAAGHGRIEHSEKVVQAVADDFHIHTAARLRAAHRFAVHGGIEVTCKGENAVANGFGIQTAHAEVAEELILRILHSGAGWRVIIPQESVRRDEEFDHVLDRAPAVNESPGQEIKQFGVGGEIAEPAKIIGGGDNAGAEHMMPDAVHHDAGGEGIGIAGQAVGKLQAAAAGGLERGGVDAVKKVPGHRCAWLLVIAANEERGIMCIGFEHAWSACGLGELRLNFPIPGKQWGSLSDGLHIVGELAVTEQGVDQFGLGVRGRMVDPGFDCLTRVAPDGCVRGRRTVTGDEHIGDAEP